MGSKLPQKPPTDGMEAKPSAPPPRAFKPKRTPHQRLESLCRELDMEMDGVRVPQTAAAILNGIRSVLSEIE